MTIIKSFTDKHGVPYTNVEMEVTKVGAQTTTTVSQEFTGGAHVTGATIVRESAYYSVIYWATPQAKIDNLTPYTFSEEVIRENESVGQRDSWHFELDSNYTGLSTIEAAEKHFKDVVLPVVAS